MDIRERDRLYLDAVEAYRRAQAALENDPPPGSPEWREWQLLVVTAEQVTAKYLKYVESQPLERPGPDRSDSN